MLSVLYEQQVQGGYPFTPRKKPRHPGSSRRPSGLRPAPGLDRITRNMNQVDFNSLEEEDDDDENTRGSYYATEGELLTPVPVRRSRRLHSGAPSVYLG
ncbi:hypothetical protein SPRG_02679 [Saprolegnia parasitica CBS 223.65]|uniref:Uncharacterized protein n=1 Tax=Saprolegnia parasitica (strain CBS 223.65) TaxID=695850 RepID=A0A067CR35_SAPPC|nr:hypothetical protein SPRG_02679 [Saprolegnia parasitica CBS 223.65]KDO32988.1 hypothetical protein SPRG_02679 [Saprolegnia parasitica CBS 223.65]|eukprot:XP_012196632.1 hypothetical protein SPRG_02679 [Saprolegnia parasitica CBS 223.65]